MPAADHRFFERADLDQGKKRNSGEWRERMVHQIEDVIVGGFFGCFVY